MRKGVMNVIICFVAWSALAVNVLSATIDARKLIEFGNVDWESEMFFLDNLDNELRNEPDSIAYIIVYGGRRGDRRNETQARIACIRDYMLNRRSISPDRIVIMNGGYRQEATVELWLVSRGERAPVATPTVSPENVRFRRGRIENWRCRCNI